MEKKSSPEAVLATEDNAEHCVGMMDAMLPWRWMYEHQVPLYCLVYSGRTQFIGREPDCEEPEAIYPKIATQLVNSEQLGYLEHQLVTSPLRNAYRVFIKQLIHLRITMLDFFNNGMMVRPPQFVRPWPRKTLIWGVWGTGTVTSDAVLASAWRNDDVLALVIVNHTPETQQSTLRYKLNAAENQLLIWRSDSAKAQKLTSGFNLELPLTLPPRSSMLIIAAPNSSDLQLLTQKINKSFKIIAQAPQTFDPFTIDALKMRSCDAGAATSWHYARNVAAVSGGRLDEPRNQINWIRDAVVSVGEVDFGDDSAGTLEATFAAPPRSGLGKAEFYIGSLAESNIFAGFQFDQKNFLTESWNTFAPCRQKVIARITGRHRVFIKLEGSSFCNLQSWRMIKE